MYPHMKDFSILHGMMLAAWFGLSHIAKWSNITLKNNPFTFLTEGSITKMEDNFLFMDSMVSYLLQRKLSVTFSFNVYSSVTSQVHFRAQNMCVIFPNMILVPLHFSQQVYYTFCSLGKITLENCLKGKSYRFRLTCVKLICLQKWNRHME